MSQQEQKQDSGLSSFAGLVVLIAFLAIFFILMTPGGWGASSAAPEATAETIAQQPTDTPTVEPTAVPTDVPTAEPTAIPTLEPTAVPTDVPTQEPAPEATAEAAVNTGAAVSFDPALAAQGQTLFTLCAACHGPDGRGVPNLGKDLVESEFVAGLDDDALVEFITVGRPIWDPLNTTGIDMPGKGGNPALTTEDIHAIVAYIRSLQAAHAGGSAEATPEATEAAADSGAGAAVSFDPALAAQGQTLFTLCAACHGPDGRGVPNLGKDLVESEFVAGLDDDALVEFITVGRPIWDPLNTTGIDMPGKGGNPALTSEDIYAIVAYIRSLQAAQ